jgi:outer membrane protein OmpA-like peptidoglycan-associated protein
VFDQELTVASAENGDDSSFWMSVGDLMSGLLLLFVLLFVVALAKLADEKENIVKIMGKEKQVVLVLQKVLEANEAQLRRATGGQAGARLWEIDKKTGDVVITKSVEFVQPTSDVLRKEDKDFLRAFTPIYIRLFAELQRENLDDVVESVVVEGRTSQSGERGYNLALSLRRASRVTQFMLKTAAAASRAVAGAELFTQKLVASGVGERYADQDKESAKDRQVRFRFRFLSESSGSLKKAIEQLVRDGTTQ